MDESLLRLIEREVISWPGVGKERDKNGPGGISVTGYRFGRKQIGHVHDDGHADFRFPKEIRDELIQSERAALHPFFTDIRATASYRIGTPEDLPGAVDPFRISFERAICRDAQGTGALNSP